MKRKGADPKKDIEKLVKLISDNADRIRISTFNTVKGMMARRIFNNGIATDGSAIGKYARSTKIFRNLTGRRIDTVDLEMSGTLRDSLEVGTSEGKTVIGIVDVPEPVTQASKKRRKGFATLQLKGTGLKVGSKDIALNIDKIQTSNYKTVENAINQEKHFNKEIFAPSKEEVERGEKTVIKELNLIVSKGLKQS